MLKSKLQSIAGFVRRLDAMIRAFGLRTHSCYGRVANDAAEMPVLIR